MESPWRKLNLGQQALLMLAYLRKAETFSELAAGSSRLQPNLRSSELPGIAS
jgi:hypothetical protein